MIQKHMQKETVLWNYFFRFYYHSPDIFPLASCVLDVKRHPSPSEAVAESKQKSNQTLNNFAFEILS